MMELPEIVHFARNFAVMVRIQGPDPKGLKMRRHAFHHHESGKTTLSASGMLLPDSLIQLPVSSNSALVVTTASVVEPFLPAQNRDNRVKEVPKLIPGSSIDVLIERDIDLGNAVAARDNNKTPTWVSAELLALVDIPASSHALQSLVKACSGSHGHGLWEVGWSLSPLNINNRNQSNVDALQKELRNDIGSLAEGQRQSLLDESSTPNVMEISTTSIALLGVQMVNSKDLPHMNVSFPTKRGDLLLVTGSPFGILSPLHFFNSISVGAVANCCPPGSSNSSVLMADVRCLPGMEGGPVFGKYAGLIGILTRPLRERAGGAEIQLVITWDAIANACRSHMQKEPLRANRNLNHPPSLLPFQKALPSVVLITLGDGAWASGIILNSSGLILTNAHLLEPWRFNKISTATEERTLSALSVRVEAMFHQEGRDEYMGPALHVFNKDYGRIRVRLDHVDPPIWSDARSIYVSKGPLDVALLQLESVPNKIYQIVPDFKCPLPGSNAHVIGHGLFGPRADLLPSVCSGVVAKVVETSKPVHLCGCGLSQQGHSPAMLETTAAVHPGVSGGAVVNSEGRMIGLVTSNARHGGGILIPHLNFSIPCAALKPIFKFSETWDKSILQAMDKPNESLSSVWALMPPPPPPPPPEQSQSFPNFPQSLLQKSKEGKGSRFAKFLAERNSDVSSQPNKESRFSAEVLPSKL